MSSSSKPTSRLYLLLLPFLFAACKAQAPDQSEPLVTADSLYTQWIDSRIDSVNEALRLSTPMPPRVAFPMYSEMDSLFLWLSNEQSGQVQATVFPEGAQLWPAYYYVAGKIILVRFREWINQQTDPLMRESMVYYKEGAPVFCWDRSMKPKPGDMPVMLRDLPFAPSQRPLSEITESYAPFWPRILAAHPELGTLEKP